MPIQFVLGRAASGKTRHCLTRIIDAAKADPLGPPIYFIVPKQATFLVQWQLAVGGELPGFCRIRVTSFDRLAEEILAEAGGDATPVVSPRGRRLILTHLLRQLSPLLTIYRISAGRLGMAEELDRTLSELDRNGCDPEQLQSLIEQIAADDPPADSPAHQLVLKLRDVLLIQNAYHAFLGQDRIDPHRRLLQVIDAVKQSATVAHAQVFVDGYLEFSDLERRFIAALAGRAAEVTITMLIDPASPVARNPHNLPDELSLFYRTERAYRRLHFSIVESDVQPLPAMMLTQPAADRPAALRLIESNWFGDGAETNTTDCATITLLSASTRRSEVAAAAATVRDWLRLGLRPREVLVLCRSLGDYNDFIEATFPEFGIPWFADRRRPAMHHPLLQTLRAIVQAWRRGFSHDAMMTLAKSGLCGVANADADQLENFILEHNLLGPAWSDDKPWQFNARPRDDEEASEATHAATSFEMIRQQLISPLRQMLRACPPTSDRLPIRTYAVALLEALSDYGAPARLASWIEAAEKTEQFELAAEHQQVWAEFTELLDELVDLLGDEALPPAEFEELLEASLAEFDLAIAPATLDQVMVGEIERTRFNHFRGVIALGWNDGDFPKVAGEPSVLGNADRAEISRRKVDLDPDTPRQLLNEPLLAYIAITRATEHLAITCREVDDSGRAIAPSTFLNHLARLLGRWDDDAPILESIDLTLATPRAVVQSLAEWARDPTAVAHAHVAAIYASLAEKSETPAAMDRLLLLAWPALSYENRAALSPATVKALFGGELKTSVSRIEAYAACAFKHFAGKTIGLMPRVEPALNSMDLGNLYHQVLESLVKRQIAAKEGWNPTKRPSPQDIRAAAEHAGAELRGSLLLSSAQNRQLLGRAQQRLDEVLLHLHTAGAEGSLLPLAAEVVFGDREASLAPLLLTTPKGRRVQLRGKIDRVDHVEGSGAVVVFDYKTREQSLSLGAVYHGLTLQLLAYLLVLEANGQTLTGQPVEGVAAFYVTILRDLQSVLHPSKSLQPESPDFALREVQRGLFHFEHRLTLDRNLGDNSASQIIKFRMKKDGEPYASGCDHAMPDDFRQIVKYVGDKLAQLSDEIMDGVIDVLPYRIGTRTPCSNCDYRAVCRFDPSMDRYKNIPALNRDQAIAAMTGGKS